VHQNSEVRSKFVAEALLHRIKQHVEGHNSKDSSLVNDVPGLNSKLGGVLEVRHKETKGPMCLRFVRLKHVLRNVPLCIG